MRRLPLLATPLLGVLLLGPLGCQGVAPEPAPAGPPEAAAALPRPQEAFAAARPVDDGALVPVPVLWTWQPPLGRAVDHPNIIQLVRVKVTDDPRRTADAVARTVTARRLGSGEVAICLQNFGMGDPTRPTWPLALFKHPHDGVSPEDAGPWWLTVWMDHGIAECRTWMNAFITEYRRRQATTATLPDPARFHFDTEGAIQPERRPKTAPAAFIAMMKDARWSTEPVPGHGGQTLAALYAAAGSPPLPANVRGASPWLTWYAGVCNQAAEGAMNEAAYAPIRRAWPRCLSSNYGTSARYDGVGDRYKDAPRSPDIRFTTNAFADLQAPVLYWPRPEHHDHLGGSLELATVTRAARIVEANVQSFGGPHRNVTPWLLMIGYASEGRGRDLVQTPELMRELLEMLRSKGVREFLLWSDESTQTDDEPWNQLAAIVDELWQPETRP